MSEIGSESGRSTDRIERSAKGPVWNRVERWLSSNVEWIVFLSLLVAFALRLRFAIGTYLNPDEALHHLLVNQSTLVGAYKASLTSAHPPLYFLLLYYWRFVGNSELMLRLPSALASCAAAWMGYRWIGIVLGKCAGLITLLLLALSPVLTILGAEVRNYSLMLLCMTGALYFLERALRDQTVSSIVYSSLFLYLAILTHYSALWFVLATGIYVLLRIVSLKGRARIAWILFQLGAVAIYAWLYVVHISQIHGSSLEASAMSTWLQDQYLLSRAAPVSFFWKATRQVFQFLVGGSDGGIVARLIFFAGVLWLFATAWLKRRWDMAAFGTLLLLPFVIGMIASFLNLYPYGGTRHSIYLVLFAAAGVSFLLATVLRQRLLPVLLLAVVIVPYWYQHRRPEPQLWDRKQQRKELMLAAIADLGTSVKPNEPVFTDYQASLLLAYYLDRDRPPPAPRECIGITEAQYGQYHVVVIGEWSANANQFVTSLDGWQKSCDSVRRESVTVFDCGWGLNLLDDLTQSVPQSISETRRYSENISLFKLRIEH